MLTRVFCVLSLSFSAETSPLPYVVVVVTGVGLQLMDEQVAGWRAGLEGVASY